MVRRLPFWWPWADGLARSRSKDEKSKLWLEISRKRWLIRGWTPWNTYMYDQQAFNWHRHLWHSMTLRGQNPGHTFSRKICQEWQQSRGPIGFTLDDLERLKVKVTNGAVTAIGMWGYTPVGLTGVLVYYICFTEWVRLYFFPNLLIWLIVLCNF